MDDEGTCDSSFAEYACARADPLAPAPANLAFEQAAAVPTSTCARLTDEQRRLLRFLASGMTLTDRAGRAGRLGLPPRQARQASARLLATLGVPTAEAASVLWGEPGWDAGRSTRGRTSPGRLMGRVPARIHGSQSFGQGDNHMNTKRTAEGENQMNTTEGSAMAVMTNTSNTSNTTKPIQPPARPGHRGWRALRGFARVVSIGFALIVGLALAGASYEAIAARGDAQAYPPPGRLIDVGGYRLHLQCVGTGSPAVVLDAGLGDMSLAWNLVQTEMGQTTQVCAYDRAGLGWSDPGPQPRTTGQIAGELHTLLTNAGIPGPYVLVGHSLGGKNVRMFALQYPDQVAGMVLVDARSEYVDAPTSQAGAQGVEPVTGSEWSFYGVVRRVGLVRLIGASQGGPPAMSHQTRTERVLLSTGQRGLDASAAEALAMTADNAQLHAAPSLGDRPLIVLAAGQSMTTIPRWTEAQHQQAASSTNGRLVVVEASGHFIQFEHPAVVIDAVRHVVAQIRGR